MGVTNALDGSEEDRVSRKACDFWDRLHMQTERASAVADLDEEVAAGRLRWTYDDVYRIICEHKKRGHLDAQPDDDGSDVDSHEGDGDWADEDEDDDDSHHLTCVPQCHHQRVHRPPPCQQMPPPPRTRGKASRPSRL